MAKPKLDRKTLLKNSLSVFKSRGYHGTSVNDLAAASGLLKGSIYHYIESKESLMLEVLNALRDHYVTRVFSKFQITPPVYIVTNSYFRSIL